MITKEIALAGPMVPKRDDTRRNGDLAWLAGRIGKITEQEAALRVEEFKRLLREARKYAQVPRAVAMQMRSFRQWS
jgi:hypothetical protein